MLTMTPIMMATMPGYELDHAPFFLAPRTPSASVTASAASSLYFSRDAGRKRVRRDRPDDRLWDSGLASSLSLVNTDYRLAGGLETSCAADDSRDVAEELDYRPNRYGDAVRRLQEILADDIPQDNNPPSNPRKRSRSVESATPSVAEVSTSWGRAVFNIVGRVWNFCWSDAFRGFYAGGGRGYHMSTSSLPSLGQSARQTVQERDDIFGPAERISTPTPGQFPAHQSRNRDDGVCDDLRSNWVLVPAYEPTHLHRKVPRRSSVGRPLSRRSTVVPRPGKRPVFNISQPSEPRPSTPAQHPTPTRSHASRASTEVQRYAAKVRRRELEEDASIQRLNDQLKAMIREGREALGSRVEIETMDPDDFE